MIYIYYEYVSHTHTHTRYCQEWQTETMSKPREIRELYRPEEPGLSVGKLQLFVDAFTQVYAP